MTLEAAIAMPFFLAFVLALICMVKLTVTDMALSHAVSETVKQMAASAYPVELLANEAHRVYQESGVGGKVSEWLGHIQAARDKVLQGEQWVQDYRAFIPDILVSLVEWEQKMREQMEQAAAGEVEQFVRQHIDPVVRSAFKEAVYHYADEQVLRKERLTVTEVELPRFWGSEQRDIGIVAEYTFRLPIPFIDKTVTLRKKAYERIWVGA